MAKLDISLVRGIDNDVVRQSLVREMLSVCRAISTRVICEGVETGPEKSALTGLGADLMRGYLFARPGPDFPTVPSSVLAKK